MLDSNLILECQALEENYFSRLDRAWDVLPKARREEIKEIVASLRSEGAICTVYDFIKGAS